MPEGDSVAGHAEMLRGVLLGEVIEEVGGSAPSLRSNSARVLGATVERIRTVGKNLVIDLSTGYSLRVHLGMSGRWGVVALDSSVPGSARLSIATANHRVICHAAPTVEVARTPAVDSMLGSLGPDLLGEFDEEEFLRRARAHASRSISTVLLDQTVLSGIGNVYKSELLFLEGIHPESPASRVSDTRLLSIADRARRLLAVNVGRGRRVTTGSPVPGRETWVYGRVGRPCRRCGTPIERKTLHERITFWCPRCQPSAGERAEI